MPSSLAQPRCSRSHGLDVSGGFLWRWDLSSPTTFYPCGFKRPSPDSLCVFRREPEGPEEATPSIRRLASQARKFTGRLHQHPDRGVTPHQPSAYASLSTAPAGNTPVSRKRQSAMSNLRATATIPIRRKRLPPLPKRSRNQHTQGTVRLKAQPTPRQLRGHPAHMPVARLGDPLFSGTLAALIRRRREAR